jgi:hypothetical protein
MRMSSNKAAVFGGIIGFSIALGVLISQDKGLKREATDQLRTVLKTTGKLVRHYRDLGNRIAGPDAPDSAEKPAWDRVLENVRAKQTDSEL